MSNLAIRLYPEALRSLAFGSISGTYAAIGSPLSNPSRIFYLLNTTDVLIIFSFDGVTDHLVLPSGGFILLDVTANMTLTGGAMAIAQGQKIYAKGTPSSGEVYLSTFYGFNG